MPTQNPLQDTIFVKRVPQVLHLGSNGNDWFGSKPHEVQISASVRKSIVKAGEADDFQQTLDYSLLYNALLSIRNDPTRQYQSITDAMTVISKTVQTAVEGQKVGPIELEFCLPKVISLSGGQLLLRSIFGPIDAPTVLDRLSEFDLRECVLENMKINALIGIRERERLQRQPMQVTIGIKGFLNEVFSNNSQGFLPLKIFKFVEESHFLTLEALAHNLARVTLSCLSIKMDAEVSVEVSKPAIFSIGDGPGVRVVRTLSDF